MGFSRFRRRRGGGMRRFARRVRRVSGVTLVKRVLVHRSSIADITSVDFDNPTNLTLLSCAEAQTESDVSDGSAVADVPLYSRITSLKLRAWVEGSTSASIMHRWVIYKSPDGDLTASTLANGGGFFHDSVETATAREMRKNILAKGILITNPSTALTISNIFVSRAALRRIRSLREDDSIKFAIAKAAEGTTTTVTLMGQFYVKANA